MSCKTGRLYLVDLAGSEKIDKTGASGQTLEEAKKINLSLTTLGKVIHALTDKKIKHIPYRESKLTRILSESLGGNSKTCLVITCSPHPFNEQETLGTLRFGTRARSIKNNAKVNREYTIPELKRLLEKAEKEIELKTDTINLLTLEIQKLGGTIPGEENLRELAEKARKQREEEEEKKAEEELQRQIEQSEIDMSETNTELTSYLGDTLTEYGDDPIPHGILLEKQDQID